MKSNWFSRTLKEVAAAILEDPILLIPAAASVIVTLGLIVLALNMAR